MNDNLDKLGYVLYKRKPTPNEWTGGSKAKILADAADAIKTLQDKVSNSNLSCNIPCKLKAFDNNGDEIPFAIFHGDFTCFVPKGYTLKKVKPNNKGMKKCQTKKI